ncbi:hypothetical protein J3F84DRAFT_146986 [Trichoderma pleuroticola]
MGARRHSGTGQASRQALGARMMACRVARFRTYRPAVGFGLAWPGLGHRSVLHCIGCSAVLDGVPRTGPVRELAEAIPGAERGRGSCVRQCLR